MKPALIIGCGDVGQRVAALLAAAGRRVTGVVRSRESQQRLTQAGIAALMADLDEPSGLRGLPTAAALLYYFAPPPDVGERDTRMEHLLASLDPAAPPSRIVYVSTTGVYGDCGGAWITERQPVNPRTARSRRRLAAESALRAWCEAFGVPVVILRVPAIYGPGRLPVERIRQRLPVVREEESPYTNRIHADDLARVCLAAGERDVAGIYNVSDGHPTTMTHYFNRVADLLGLPRPPTVSMEEARRSFSPGLLSYLEESRRLDNRKMREELQVELLYPDLESGLPGCL